MCSVLTPDSWLEEEGGSDEWDPLVSEREEMGGLPIREGEKLDRGPLLGLGRKGRPRAFYPFLF
jgi:hypothetical protein